MAYTYASLDEVLDTREKFIQLVQASLTEKNKQFLISFKRLNPDWSLLYLNNIQELPAVKWKLLNLSRMKAPKHKEAIAKLSATLAKF